MTTPRPWRAIKHVPHGSADAVDQIVGPGESGERVIAIAAGDDQQAEEDFDFIVAAVAVVDQIIDALYADRETGKLTGENTIAEKSGADFVDVVTQIIHNNCPTAAAVASPE